ncbi:phosphoadenylyl-sulfate reductase [Candidatus Purcelliella pentastirinorum]|uniref:Phosphoadenosine 5'-phosphosulfate reductase n=1 Tax=Candidatus Purcelliella pentastirinorum TaxID=472834 RepID=A0AAX3N7Z8_9ENTR|nr:phosphoadenylyl-sulfate reductase [Candidatus Purcelliella pentastirinorum]WDI78692.1 phosphoadenylyl-sulfate reductase [Candidatus Purcelliella pentastirinorum]
MQLLNLKKIKNLSLKEQKKNLEEINFKLNKLSSFDRILWALDNLEENFILSSSFGIQSMVLLHMITSKISNIPIVFIDTGYLFPETYIFVDKLVKKMNLNLKIFRSIISPAWQEARYGKLWKNGIDGIDLYNKINKVKPMKFALKKLLVKTWFSGLRRSQSKSRKNLSILSIQRKIFKFLPILDWDNKKIFDYIKKYDLEYHPLWKDGYVSLGDIHTTSKINSNISEEETRFFGIKRECGLHE